ncbi:hypothetical protein CVT24_008479 [Panaeolus cyanescens]|uniref:F-box domain-containing protein n=1 Tax=Panaeolus cyanescens TaxID=181874 RepID=A0A409VD34_9AGAR|nr:hypothetical protein CVT24_008479 [Panaeolus cyanescens]
MTSTDLPLEIWQEIIKYLPKEFVETLYSVNRHLLQLALDYKYKVAVLDASARRQYAIIPRQEYSPPGMLQLLVQRLRCLKRSKLLDKSPLSLEDYYSQAKQAILAMEHIRQVELCLAVVTEKEHLSKLRLTKAILELPSNEISNLYLDCALEHLSHILTTGLRLRRLSTFRLSLYTIDPLSDPASHLPLINTFFIHHQSSIETLELHFGHTVDPSSFLKDAPHFPALSRLLLSFPVLESDPTLFSGLKEFVTRHSNHLHSLELYVRRNPFHHRAVKTPVGAAFSIGADAVLVHYPNLVNLTLNMYPAWVSGITHRPHIEKYKSTLETLQIQTCVLTFDDMHDVFSDIFPCLRRLSMTVTCLSPHHLALLASTLPSLKHLTLRVTQQFSSEPRDSSQPDLLTPFAQDIPLVTDMLSSWHLASIDIVPLYKLENISLPDRRALVTALPHTVMFCEVRRDEYASSFEDPGEAMNRLNYWGSNFSPNFFPHS